VEENLNLNVLEFEFIANAGVSESDAYSFVEEYYFNKE
jgi:hypothetical protein